MVLEAPALPREGDYPSVQRDDHERPFGDEMIVAKLWWRFCYPETGPVQSDPPEGWLDEVIVEGIPAVGPWSSDQWRDDLARFGAPEFEVSRLSIRESELAAMRETCA